MTLEEAITHCEEVAEEKYNEAQESIMCNRFQYADDCRDCAEEHRQLAEWLKELKEVKEIIQDHDNDKMPEDYWYIDKIRKAVEVNADDND